MTMLLEAARGKVSASMMSEGVRAHTPSQKALPERPVVTGQLRVLRPEQLGQQPHHCQAFLAVIALKTTSKLLNLENFTIHTERQETWGSSHIQIT